MTEHNPDETTDAHADAAGAAQRRNVAYFLAELRKDREREERLLKLVDLHSRRPARPHKPAD